MKGENKNLRRKRSRPNHVTDNVSTIFPKWPDNASHRVTSDRTYRDPEAIPLELRTKKEHDEFDDGGFQDVEPITTLRRPFLRVFAEIVCISYWIGYKGDGRTFYQVNLVRPSNFGFDRDQRGTVSFDYNLGCGFSEFKVVTALLADAEKFIEWHQKQTR